MKALKVIINGESDLEATVFQRLEAQNLIEVCGFLVWSDKPSLSSTLFPKTKRFNQRQLINSILSGDFDSFRVDLISSELEKSMAWAEPIIMDMISRLDSAKSISYLERKNVYRYLMAFWLNFLEETKPNLFYSRATPHEVSDFILFCLCKIKNIRVLTFNHTAMPGRRVLDRDYRHPWKCFENFSYEHRDKNEGLEILDSEKQKYILSIRGEYSSAMPIDLKEVASYQNSVFELKKIPLIFKEKISFFFKSLAKKMLSIGCLLLAILIRFFGLKSKSKNLERFSLRMIKSDLVQIEYSDLKNFYDKNTTSFDFTKPYIYFALNFQPEMTTCPHGGVFNDQVLAISLISRNLPEGWSLLVKEHPAQFFTNNVYGYIGRDETFYKKILSLPNVFFVPRELDQFFLIDRAKCVATITGTAGWEASIRGRAVIIFGDAWYQFAPNVYRVSSDQDFSTILPKINKVGIFDESELVHFMKNLTKNSRLIYFEEYEAKLSNKKFNFLENADALFEIISEEIFENRI
jgi:hypothetical protein